MPINIPSPRKYVLTYEKDRQTSTRIVSTPININHKLLTAYQFGRGGGIKSFRLNRIVDMCEVGERVIVP